MRITLELSEDNIKDLEFMYYNLADVAHYDMDDGINSKHWDSAIGFIDDLYEEISRNRSTNAN